MAVTPSILSDNGTFRNAVESSSDHIIITDVDGTIIYANPAAQSITGYPMEEMLGKTPRIWGGLMEKEFYKKLWDTLKNKRQSFNAVVQNKRKNGEIYYAILRASPILDEKKVLIGFVATEEDITERIRIDKAKSEFVALASHQLRTPLTTIRWYAEMLESGSAGPLGDKQKEYLHEMYEANKHLIGLVSSLLNVSRIELGTFSVDPKPIKLSGVAEQVLKEIEPIIKQKSLNVTKSFDPAIGDFIGDENLLHIVFQNLLTNACKYTKDNGTVGVVIEKHEADQTIMIGVSDTGVGIPLAAQGQIFTKLFRADNVREIDQDGNGLGLYIVKSILDACGGSISFESLEGKGTTFTVRLPLAGMKKKEGTKSLEKGGPRE